jgi:ribosomal-protein-alanine N-acetyltransferase
MDTPAHFPTLETERLVLRPFIDDDIEFLYRHFSDPAVTRYLYDSPPFTELSEARDLVEFYRTRKEGGPNRWGIVTKADNMIIGTCGYHNWARPYHRAEIGYDLSPEAWGYGYMIEALRAVADHGFGKMSLNRIEALVFEGNTASIRLLEKLGFEGEGVLRDYFCLNNTFYDHRIFSLLKRDWVAR